MAKNWEKMILKKQENEKIKGILFKNTSHLTIKRLFHFHHDKSNYEQDTKFVCLLQGSISL